jgi:hypothetical protein
MPSVPDRPSGVDTPPGTSTLWAFQITGQTSWTLVSHGNPNLELLEPDDQAAALCAGLHGVEEVTV